MEIIANFVVVGSQVLSEACNRIHLSTVKTLLLKLKFAAKKLFEPPFKAVYVYLPATRPNSAYP